MQKQSKTFWCDIHFPGPEHQQIDSLFRVFMCALKWVCLCVCVREVLYSSSICFKHEFDWGFLPYLLACILFEIRIRWGPFTFDQPIKFLVKLWIFDFLFSCCYCGGCCCCYCSCGCCCCCLDLMCKKKFCFWYRWMMKVALILITAVCLYPPYLTQFHRHLQWICSLVYSRRKEKIKSKYIEH